MSKGSLEGLVKTAFVLAPMVATKLDGLRQCIRTVRLSWLILCTERHVIENYVTAEDDVILSRINTLLRQKCIPVWFNLGRRYI